MNEVSVSEETTGRVLQLEKEVHQISSEMHKQSTSIGELSATVLAQQRAIEKVGSNVEKLVDAKGQVFTPSLIFGAIAGIFAFFLGLAQYTDQQNEPQNVVISHLDSRISGAEESWSDYISTIEEFRTEMHYEVAQLHAMKEEMYRRWETEDSKDRHFDERRHILEDRIAELETETARSIQGMKVIGEHLAKHIQMPDHYNPIDHLPE